MPPADVYRGRGTMSSPCPPSSRACTSSTLQPTSAARKLRKRAVSSTPAWPITLCGANPLAFQATYTIASSGLLTTINTASGLVLATLAATSPTILVLVAIRSSRLMPGLRGSPAVMITTSLAAVSA